MSRRARSARRSGVVHGVSWIVVAAAFPAVLAIVAAPLWQGQPGAPGLAVLSGRP